MVGKGSRGGLFPTNNYWWNNLGDFVMAKIKKRNNQWYGWKPDIPDFRDFTLKISDDTIQNLPEKVDLRNPKLPIFNQLRIGSCTSQAIATAHMFNQIKQSDKEPFIPSRLFIYFNEREMMGNVEIDSGAHLRDGIKSLNSQGVCEEIIWPYDISKFKDKPTPECYKDALNHQAVTYERVVQTEDQLRGCLASGFPFVFGFAVYEFFESKEMAKTGVLKMPEKDEKMLGGHAVICISYDYSTKTFLIQNSWGRDFGQNGFFTMPFEYILHPQLAADFWAIKLVEID